MADRQTWAQRAYAAANDATDVMREVSADIFKTAHVGQMIALRRSGQDRPWAVYTVVAATVSSTDPVNQGSAFEPMLVRIDSGGPVLFPPARPGYLYPNPTFDGYRPADLNDLVRLINDHSEITQQVRRDLQAMRSRGQRVPTAAAYGLPGAEVPGWQGH